MLNVLLEKLGLRSVGQDDPGTGASPLPRTELGRRLLEGLGELDPDRLRFLAAFGGLMGRVALADSVITEEEDRRIRDLLVRIAHLSKDEAELVRRIVHEQAKALAGIENHEYIREINQLSDEDRKIEVLSCLFAVAAADGGISPEENRDLQTIASGLLLTRNQFIAVRSLYRESLSFLKDLPGSEPG